MGDHARIVQFGAHLPLIDLDGSWNGGTPNLAAYARTARDAGFTHLCANDHLVFSRPWLDGIVALSSVAGDSGSMTLMTTVALPVVRGAAAMAKALAALDLVSGGRVVSGLGPGSSARDYALVGLNFEQRWPLFERSVRDVRSYLRGGAPEGAEPLLPLPANSTLPLWIGSWGSEAGLRRVARLADGWLASAYNTNPATFAEAQRTLSSMLTAASRQPLPNALGTMWMYITEDPAEARVKLEMLATMLRRPAETLKPLLLIGAAEHCAAVVRAYEEAGVERLFVWPLADEPRQLELFMKKVALHGA